MSGQGGGPEPAPATPGAAPAEDAAAGAPDQRVAEVLQRLRSGVRQRQAEAATIGGLGGLGAGDGSGSALGLAQGLLALKSHEYVQEPVPFSHRPRFGKGVVWSRKAFFHLFLKWFIRPVLAQQNAFNQAAGRMLQELAEAHERTAREARLLAGRLAALEARADEAAAAAAADRADPGTPPATARETPTAEASDAAGEGDPRR
jgi:hypothetical protein